MRNTLRLEILENKVLKEFDRICNVPHKGYQSDGVWNECILFFQWKEFYKKEIELWEDNQFYKYMPLRSYIYANRLKYINKGALELTDREILRAFKISGVHIGNSFHSPFWIKQFIKDYNIKSVYDPCGGWGHRLLGAVDVQYIYNDINKATFENCIRMSDYFNIQNNIFYNEDCAKFTPQESYQAVFTCPPYHDTEIYSEWGAENYSYPEFLMWWKDVVQRSIKDSTRYFCFIINSKYKKDMQQICERFGLYLMEDVKLGHLNLNHFQRKSTNIRKGEYLLIFKV